jgi:HK97 family phage major capsid protein
MTIHPASIKAAGSCHRTVEIESGSARFSDTKGTGIVEASVSSTSPYERWEGVKEVLDHSESAVVLDRASKGLSLLLHHDPTKIIGVAENFRLAAGKLRATLRFGKSEEGLNAWKDVEAGVLRHISIGYQILESRREGHDTLRVTRWEPQEVSLVAIPADVSVGIGRSLNISKEKPPMTIEHSQPGGLNAERNRISEILSLGRRFGASVEAENAIRDGQTVDAFRGLLVDKISASQLPPNLTANTIGLDVGQRDKRASHSFSLGRAIAAQVTGDWSKAGLEREVSQELAKNTARRAQGFYVPSFALAKRSTQVAASNGLVGTEHMDNAFINALVNRAMVLTLGATRLPGLNQSVSIPRQASNVSASWYAEDSTVSESAPTFDSVAMAPKQCSARVAYSMKLLAQGLPSIEQLMINDLNSQIALAIDAAAISGTGASNQPRGILATSGIGLVSIGTNGGAPSFANVIGLETEVAMDNADFGSVGYLTNAKVRGKLKATEKAATSGQFIWQDGPDGMGLVNGYRAAVSNQVPGNLTKGTAAGVCSAIIFGNWQDLLIGEWGAIDVIIDPYSDGAKGNVRIYAHAFVDISVRHPESFAAMVDVLT